MKMQPVKIEVELDGARMFAAVAEQAAQQLAGLLEPEARSEVAALAIEEARTKAREELERVISTPFVRTNAYGEKMGEAMTLRDLVAAEITKALKVQVSGSARLYDQGRTLIERLVADEVRRQVGTELADAMKEAALEVKAAIKDQGAQVLAETIERLAKGRL